MKSILFNTDMVRAVLDGKKTVTRRAVKPQPPGTAHVAKVRYSWCWSWWEDSDSHQMKPPYCPGDILYVRETFFRFDGGRYAYKAESNDRSEKIRKELGYKWCPPLYMPREAARIFLRVTDVRVERLQDINERGRCSAEKEGFVNDIDLRDGTGKSASKHFCEFWDSTIKPADRALYGWVANPWVWVIEFERISKERRPIHKKETPSKTRCLMKR